MGSRAAIAAAAERCGIDLAAVEVIDPVDSPLTDGLARALLALREKKGMTPEQAATAIREPLCFANMLVREGHADGSVAGAVNTTADVVRSAIQLLGLAPGSTLVSSFFLMMLCKPFHSLKGGMIFSDCGLVIDPDAGELAQIAMAAADSAQALLDEDPRVAMLSFSTSGSARHGSVEKVVQAAREVKAARPALAIDEDVQLDAAIVASVAERKLPDSKVMGNANVLIFPDLEAGNIGYKLAERIGGAEAIGPLLLDVLSGSAESVLRIALGLLVCYGGLSLVLHPRQRETLSSRGSFFISGVLSGLCGGLFGIAGPPVIYQCYRQPLPPVAIRNMLILIFAATSGMRTLFVALRGELDLEILTLTAWAIPVVALVTYAGRRWLPRLSPLAMRRVAFVTLMVIGGGLIAVELL